MELFNFLLKGNLFLIIFIVINSAVVHSASKIVNVGYGHFPPFTYTEKGTPKGLYNEIIQKVLNDLGYEFTLKELPVKRLYYELKKGEVDIWMGVESEVIRSYTISSEKQIMKLDIMAYFVKKRDPRIKIPKKIEDFSNQSVITIFGYTYGQLLNFLKAPENNVELFNFPTTHKRAFKTLLNNERTKFLLDYRYPASIAIGELKIADKVDSSLISSVPLKWIISKKRGNCKKLLKVIEASFDKLVKNGDISLPSSQFVP
jgi:ABC-type amino acid transport substrate-binding protein